MIVGKRDGRTDGSYCAAQTVEHKFVRGCGLACLTDMSHCARWPAPCTAPAAFCPLLGPVRGPALVVADIVARHQFRRQQLDCGSRLLAVEDADADLHGAAGHEERVLRGGGLDLRRLR